MSLGRSPSESDGGSLITKSRHILNNVSRACREARLGTCFSILRSDPVAICAMYSVCSAWGLFSGLLECSDSWRVPARGVHGFDSESRMSRRIWRPRGVSEFDLMIRWPSISRLKNSFTMRFHDVAGEGVSSASPLLGGDPPLSLPRGRPGSSRCLGALSRRAAWSSSGATDGGVFVVEDPCARSFLCRLWSRLTAHPEHRRFPAALLLCDLLIYSSRNTSPQSLHLSWSLSDEACCARSRASTSSFRQLRQRIVR